MSEAENLLDQLADGDAAIMMANPETEPHIVIGTDRFITVPTELRRIGVQYDHNIETVMFDCPRYWDGRDLSAMRVYVNYMRSDGGVGMYLAEDVTIDETDENIMHFSWILSGNATKSKGSLSFLVCAKAVDGDGNEVNHWNSELNREMTISEGLEVQETIINQYPDIITTLLVRMESVEYYYEDFKRISAETKQYVDEAIASSDANLTGYATEEYVDGKISGVEEYVDGKISGVNVTLESNTGDIASLNGRVGANEVKIESTISQLENVSVDYIVERGTNDMWTWEKWNSGKAVCWGIFNVYYQDVNKLTNIVDFPCEIIGDIFAQVTKISGAAAFNTLYATACYEATSTQIFIALCNSGVEFSENDTLALSVYLIGRWKNEGE